MSQLFVQTPIAEVGGEESRARELANRYRCEFVDLRNHHIQHELFRKVPVDLMFRDNFIPLEELPDGRLAMGDARQPLRQPLAQAGLVLVGLVWGASLLGVACAGVVFGLSLAHQIHMGDL